MKIKREIFLVLLLLNSIAIIAQKNQVKIGGGMGSTPYEGTPGWNVDFQYEYKVTPKLSGFTGVGMNGDKYTAQGRSSGTSGTDTWNNNWKYDYSERFIYIDIGLKYKIFELGERYEMKASVGGSLGQSIFQYPEDIFINRGIIERQDEVTRKVEVGLFLLGFENYIYLTDRLFLNLNLILRTTFKEKYLFTREIKFHNNFTFVTSGILYVPSINLQVGYLF